MCWSLFCDPGCGLSWSVLPGCLKRVFILLLFDGQLCKRPLGPVAWWRFCLLLNLRWLCVDVPSFADSGVWRSLSESYNFRFGYFFFQLYCILLYTHTHTHMYICIILATPCGKCILVVHSGIEPTPPALEGKSLNHWTTREVPLYMFLTLLFGV